MFPLYLISDPTSVISDDKKDIYNNILLFTVLEDTKKKTSTPSEMHIFQCVKTHSAEIVDELYKAKEGRRQNQPGAKNMNSSILTSNPNQLPSVNGISQSTPIMNTKLTANPNDMITTSQVDSEVQILNHCFDDIERFVTRLQSSSEHFKEVDKQRHKNRTKPATKKTPTNEASKAQMPPPQQFIDIFQKFKLSFLLLARLKAHIHDPNAPELVHFLFTPLSLILNATKEQPYRGLAKTVWVPMINKETKDLLLNCLTSKEQDLWMSLGDAWTITKEEAKLQPHLYANVEFQTYTPIFYDGWSPSVDVLDNNNNDMSHLAFASAAQVQMQSQTNSLKQITQPLPIQKFRFYTNTQPQLEEQFNGTNNTNNMSNLPPSSANSVSKYNPNQSKQMDMRTNQANTLTSSNNMNNSKSNEKLITIRNYDEMKRWAIDLAYRGAKVYECIHDRNANNDKELTVKSGELLEVLDDKRNWWRLRNFYGNIGHAPVTILRQFEFSTVNNGNGLTMNGHHHSSHHQANHVSDKVGYF